MAGTRAHPHVNTSLPADTSTRSDAPRSPRGQGRYTDLDARALGERLRQLRTERGLTLAQVAGRKFSAAFLSQVERGLVRPSAANLAYIADRLGIDRHQLLQVTPRAADREVAELRLVEARAAMAREDPTAVLQALDALPDPLAASDALEAAVLRADALIHLGRHQQAAELIRAAVDAAPATVLAPDIRLRIAEVMGRSFYRRQRYHQALQALREAESCLDDAGVDPMTRSRFLRARGMCLFMLGSESDAIRDYEAALDASGTVADLAELGRIYDALNSAHQTLGNYAEALGYARRSAQIFEVLHNARHLGHTQHNIGELFLKQGDFDAAAEAFHKALAAFRAVGALAPQAYALHGLATVALRRGNLEEAERLAAEASAVAAPCDDHLVRGDVAQLRGDIAMARDDLDGAEAHLLDAVSAFEQAGGARRLAEACYLVAQVLQRKGHTSRALTFAMRAYVAPSDDSRRSPS